RHQLLLTQTGGGLTHNVRFCKKERRHQLIQYMQKLVKLIRPVNFIFYVLVFFSTNNRPLVQSGL
ncbi:MAG: hypothetical protein ACXWV1_11095, partial [Chitinophagaceae bacterium]